VILPIIEEIIAKNPENVEKFRNGNTKLLGFFVGQVLKATKGKGNPRVVNELVAQQLDKTCSTASALECPMGVTTSK